MKNHIKSDEQANTHQDYAAINWVGMSKIQSCILIEDQMIPIELEMQVDLKSGQRGIHMSRLYALQMSEIMGQTITTEKLDSLLKKCVVSQDGISGRARLKIKFHSLHHTVSLRSEVAGFRSYPVEITAEGDTDGLMQRLTQFVILYSSTCPQSAKLSKEVFKNSISQGEDLDRWYDSNNIYPAVPHAQRSQMQVELITQKNIEVNVAQWIRDIETCLKTGVQTAVKKVDEMEFARLNAVYPMFCEDAVRKVALYIGEKKEIFGYRVTAEHFESLHPHNATSQMRHNFSLNFEN